MYAKTDRDDVVRDLESKAVVSRDHTALQAYKTRKKATREQKQRLNNLERDVAEIKSMLAQLLAGMSK